MSDRGLFLIVRFVCFYGGYMWPTKCCGAGYLRLIFVLVILGKAKVVVSSLVNIIIDVFSLIADFGAIDIKSESVYGKPIALKKINAFVN
ncbi:hypothetical protein CHUAL_001613 [Chamberlinius hualienensis]